MAVEVYTSNVLASGGGTPTGIGSSLTFSDNFNRGTLGSNWIVGQYYLRLPEVNPKTNPQIFLNANRLRCSNDAVNNPGSSSSLGVYSLPCRISTMGKNQTVQCTFIGAAGPQFNGGLCAMVSPDIDLTMYIMYVANSAQWIFVRYNSATGVNVTGNFHPLAVNDVMKMTVDISVAGVTTLRGFINGTLIETANDNSGSRLNAGFAGGFLCDNCVQTGGVGSTMDFDDYSCGVGLL